MVAREPSRTSPAARTGSATPVRATIQLDMTLEVITVTVSDVDRAKSFVQIPRA